MRARASIALLPLACLLGCGLPSTPPASTTTTPAGNWQIQTGTAITSPPTGLYFTGAVQTQDTQSSAVFTNFGSTSTGSQVLSLLGTYNSSTSVVALYPVAVGPFVYDIDFAEPSVPYTVIPVSVIGGCVYPLNYQGPECMAITGGPAVGVQIAPLNGTFTGTLTVSTTPSMSGTGSLSLTQSTTPNADGSFSLTGTVTFPSNSGIGTYTTQRHHHRRRYHPLRSHPRHRPRRLAHGLNQPSRNADRRQQSGLCRDGIWHRYLHRHT